MDGKKSSSILRLSLKALLLSMILEPALCNTGCKSGQNLTDSTIYALDITHETKYRAIVKIYSNNCTVDVEAVGPRWYRLDVIGSARDLGEFKEPWEYTQAVNTPEGIEFSSEDPLVLLDLPRIYKWETTQLPLQAIKLCFRLVIQEGNSCQQVVTSNCTAELQQQLILEQETENGSEEEDLTPAPTTVVTTEAAEDLTKKNMLLCIASNPRLNCTGKRVKPTCGSNGIWYKNTCTLRLHRCIHNIETLQRDLKNKSCMDPPPTSFPPPVPPTTVAPPTPPTPSPCRDVRKNYIEENYPLPPRCLDQVSFRPIQCWPIGGSSSVYCTCTDPITGASYGGSSWIHTCPSPILTQPPPLQCGF